jgi:hypothetical protein
MVVVFTLKVLKWVGSDPLAYMINSLIKYVISEYDVKVYFPPPTFVPETKIYGGNAT